LIDIHSSALENCSLSFSSNQFWTFQEFHQLLSSTQENVKPKEGRERNQFNIESKSDVKQDKRSLLIEFKSEDSTRVIYQLSTQISLLHCKEYDVI
jgi:hypothetical protein